MKIAGRHFSPAWISAAILLVAYLISTGRALVISHRLSQDRAEDTSRVRTIHMAHWQLEPGYREGLQWAIDEYNALPHVRDANYRVEQMAITERVYTQFLNVHLIAGTAPDIAVASGPVSAGGDMARFFSALGDYVNDPNPYNAPEYQRPGLDPELAESLATDPWRNTFFDNLEGGFNVQLNDYFAVPASIWGGIRLFYNVDLLSKAKQLAHEASQSEPQPAWLERLWQAPGDGDSGYLLQSEDNLAWLADPEAIPETLGQFFLFCYAAEAYAESIGSSTLKPISGSNYPPSNLALDYKYPFLANFHEEIDFFTGTGLIALEIVDSFSRRVWDFDQPAVKAYFHMARELSNFYPAGFLGLDREQAIRRFVLGQATVISAGGWDASSIFTSVNTRDQEGDRFKVVVGEPPLPAPGERWYQYLKNPMTEAETKGGVPLSINKQSRHFNQSLDFLKFLSSHRINERFNAQAGWLPVAHGAEPVEHMVAFMPSTEGIPGGWTIRLNNVRSGIGPMWTRNLKQFFTGNFAYEDFAATVTDYLDDPRLGWLSLWQTEYQRSRDISRARDRIRSIDHFKSMFMNEASAADRERALILDTVIANEGADLRNAWSRLYPDTPFLEQPLAK